MISSFGVVLDACVLVPMSLCDILLTAADRRLYRPLWSQTILDEMERHVARQLVKRGRDVAGAKHAARYRREAMVVGFPEAEITGFESLINCMTNEEKDRHVVAAAVRAAAAVIVTSNLRDFSETALGELGIVAQTPDDFLKDLLGFEPQGMIDAVCDMAASKSKPPLTSLEIVKRIGKAAPDFAAATLIMIEELEIRTL